MPNQRALKLIGLKKNTPLALFQTIEEIQLDLDEKFNLFQNQVNKILQDMKTQTDQEFDLKFNELLKIKEDVVFKGLKQIKGDVGIQGPRGEKGDSIIGPQGEQGIQGVPGPPGDMGKIGLRGKAGKDGVDGKDGKDGKDAKVDINKLSKEIIDNINDKLQPQLEKILRQVRDMKRFKGQYLSGGGFNQNRLITEETPSGTVNGVNTTFTLTNTPETGTTRVYEDGIRLKLTDDYTISGNTITWNTAPVTDSILLVDYIRTR